MKNRRQTPSAVPAPGPLDRRDMPATREPASLVTVDRAAAELRRGRLVAIQGAGGQAALVRAVERLDESALDNLRETAGAQPVLVITARRAVVLGLKAPKSRVVAVGPSDGKLTAGGAVALADPVTGAVQADTPLHVEETSPYDRRAAAVQLMKIARLLPAAAVADIDTGPGGDLEAWARRRDIILADGGDIFRYEVSEARTLSIVGEARVPVFPAPDLETRLYAFRPADGGLEHLALVIGDPPRGEPVLARLHSECFTGDLLGSLRCDCGDQLKGAMEEIGRKSGGILLYLAQEGRGIGLVNKLRAYELQDKGFDTIDANEQLGFEPDERIYLPAAQMFRLLGFESVRLLTNNPDKVAALARAGIAVTERVAHRFPSNRHNEAYLRTKRERSGHLF